MRKTTTFMIVIALIGVLCSSVFLFTAKHARFPLKNEQGNRSVLKSIPFDSIVSLMMLRYLFLMITIRSSITK